MLVLSWQNAIYDPDVQLFASGALGNMPVSNLADPRRGRRWRSATGGCSAWALFSARPVDLLALAFPRDTANPVGTVRHRLDPAGGVAGTGLLYDSGDIPINSARGYGYHVHRLPQPVDAGIWHWQYSLSASFCDTGLAWCGEAWSPVENVAVNYTDAWTDLSRVGRSARSGAEFPDEGPRQRLLTFATNFLTEDDRQTVREMKRITGISKQVLAVLRPEDVARETIIGRMQEASPIMHPSFGIYSTPFTIRESI